MGRVMTILAVIGVVAAAYFTYRYGVGGGTLSFLGLCFLPSLLVFFPEPGLRPAAQSLPFASPKASNQVKGDPAAPDPSLCEGQPASRQSRGALRNSRRAKALWSNSRNESDDEAVASLDATATA